MIKNINNKKDVFAYGLGFYKLFWIFFIGSFFGAIVETIWCAFTQHKFEVRWGLIYGPFNPIYGFGAVIMTLCLNKLSFLRDLWIFLICMFVGASFEYLCSLFQEIVFNAVSWDYSVIDSNFSGRTSILFAFFWGVLGLVWVKDTYPRLSGLIEKIPKNIGIFLTWILFVYMIFNMGISSMAVWRQGQRANGIKANSAITEFLDENYTDDFLKVMYPNMVFVK